MVRNSPIACGAQNVGVTRRRAVTAGLGVVYVAASAIAPLILKTTPSDLDLYFWPSAETLVSGHSLLIYAGHVHGLYQNDNGPLGLVPLLPAVALANVLGWAGSLAGRAALTGVVTSLVVLLLAYQTVRLISSARGSLRWPVIVACTVLLAPALWSGVLDYGHVEQPVELCFALLAITLFLRTRNALTGVALGAAVLARTIAGFCVIPLLLVPLTTRRFRSAAMIALAGIITVGVLMAPFVLADEQAVTHSLLTYRPGLPIGGGSFWVLFRQASWAGLIRTGDVYLAAAVAIVLAALALRHHPAVANTYAGLAGLLTIAACCFPLFAKSVYPYYLVEPYVFSVLWWLARPGNALNWRLTVPLLLTIDVFIVKVASASPFSAWGETEGVLSSAVIAVAIAMVTIDLLRPPEHSTQAAHRRMDRVPERIPTTQDAT
jgi:hypothetical protein